MLSWHEAAQALAICPVDDRLLHRHDATVFEHELARQLRGGTVGEGRDDGLLQQARSLESGSNDEVRHVHLTHSFSDPRSGLANQLCAVLAALEHPAQLKAIAMQANADVPAVNGMRLVCLPCQHGIPPRGGSCVHSTCATPPQHPLPGACVT